MEAKDVDRVMTKRRRLKHGRRAMVEAGEKETIQKVTKPPKRKRTCFLYIYIFISSS